MTRNKNTESFRIAIGIILLLSLTACNRQPMKGMIIFTQVVPAELKLDSLTGGNWKYTAKSRIVAVDPANPGTIKAVLTDGFFAARSPEISFNGKKMLFAGQREKDGTWQIYELTFRKNKIRQVTDRKSDCTDPCYLPGNKIVFSSFNHNDSSAAGNSLYTCGLDGCCLDQITFHPNSDFSTSVLSDGSIVTLTWQVYPGKGKPVYLSMRPDGTKARLYYDNVNGRWFPGKIRELNDGRAVLVESESDNPEKGKLVSIESGRPLSSGQDISGREENSFFSVYPGRNGRLIVSCRKPGGKCFGIYEYDPVKRKLLGLIYEDKEYNSIEPVFVTSRVKPRDLPTEISVDKTTGLVMCLNADHSRNASLKEGKTAKIQVLGLKGLISEVPVAEDGSFYIDLTADSPVRFMTVNAAGEILRGPCSWIWIRRNERRGCIGCHEEPELAPENRVADAIKSMPVKVIVPGWRSGVSGNADSTKMGK
jgi:hypothetical protein